MRPPRTMLEQKIRERRQTLEEFAESAERFAREHGEAGTLGVRHLQRLVSGRGPEGRPLGPVRPATARLLEHMLGSSIDELLAPAPVTGEPVDEATVELRQRLHASLQVDDAALTLLRDQLSSVRRLDRQLGAVIAHEEVCVKTDQVSALLDHSLPGRTREQLASLLSELHTLAGWQALDLGKTVQSWQHYEQAKRAARESGIEPFEIHTTAEQAFVLLDIGETRAAVNVLAATRRRAQAKSPKLLRAWLAAAHGEALAADDQRDESLRAFDAAFQSLPTDPHLEDGPYVALDNIHLARWRGHGLARNADPAAIGILTAALQDLHPTFTRAEVALRVDLATAYVSADDRDASQEEASKASFRARSIGSIRQQRRIESMLRAGST